MKKDTAVRNMRAFVRSYLKGQNSGLKTVMAHAFRKAVQS